MTFPPPNSRFDLIDGYMIPMIEIPSAAIINQTAVEGIIASKIIHAYYNAL